MAIISLSWQKLIFILCLAFFFLFEGVNANNLVLGVVSSLFIHAVLFFLKIKHGIVTSFWKVEFDNAIIFFLVFSVWYGLYYFGISFISRGKTLGPDIFLVFAAIFFVFGVSSLFLAFVSRFFSGWNQ